MRPARTTNARPLTDRGILLSWIPTTRRIACLAHDRLIFISDQSCELATWRRRTDRARGRISPARRHTGMPLLGQSFDPTRSIGRTYRATIALLLVSSTLAGAFAPSVRVALRTRTLRTALSVRLDGTEPAQSMPDDGAAEAPSPLISLDSISPSYAAEVEAAFVQRNKERVMSGQPKYKDIADMVTKYMEFEGSEKGMTRAEAESEVHPPPPL